MSRSCIFLLHLQPSKDCQRGNRFVLDSRTRCTPSWWGFNLFVVSQLLQVLPATAVTFVAFVMSFSQHHMVTLLASLTSFLAALLVREASRNTCPSPHSHPQTLIAFAIDIALYAFVHHEIGKLPDVSGNTNTSAGMSRPSFSASPPYLCPS